MLINIFIGILGLGIVVLVHEFGHLVIAKFMGINVEIFSIGMGKKLLSVHYGKTEYRISIFPIGGYCKMKGEEQFNKAIKEKSNSVSYEKGSIFSASPIRRIATYLAGPIFNLIFSIIVLSIIWIVGFTINTYSNKIILLSDYPEIFNQESNPADISGIMTGDKIISINDNIIQNYSHLQEIIYSSPGKTLSIIVERDTKKISLSITPLLNKETGTGIIGVTPWIEPIVENIIENSSAYIAGLKQDDIIKTANKIRVTNYLDIHKALSLKPEYLNLSIDRNGAIHNLTVVPIYENDGSSNLGIELKFLRLKSENTSVFSSIKKGTIETFNTFIMTAKSIYLLFLGIDMKKAVSGPIRISYYVGEIASNSFKEGIRTGLTTIFRFLSIISVAVGFVNLLPIPIFDGGLILFTSIELIKKEPIKPSVFYRYQSIGFVIIVIIFFLTTYSDISYLSSK